MHLSSSVAGWIALGAAVAAAVALLIALLHFLTLRRVRKAQLVLLGGGGKDDLVDFAVSLQARIDDLHRAVDEVSAALAQVDRRVDETVSKTAIVRYDAYENSGGHQSAAMAMLDSSRTGVVLSAIQGRDYARIYVKELDRGRASVALSPEELKQSHGHGLSASVTTSPRECSCLTPGLVPFGPGRCLSNDESKGGV